MKKTKIAVRVADEAGFTKRRLGQPSAPCSCQSWRRWRGARTFPSSGSTGLPRKTGRPARGRNPRTGERIAIGPLAGVSFEAAKPLKDALC